MSRFGGKDGRSTARTIAQTILDDNLCIKYTWSGTHVKASFKPFKDVIDAILSAVRSKHATYTLYELADFFKKHLRQSKSRLGRKIVSEN